MSSKTIITAAVTGNIVKPDQHPNLPVTPEQIADAVLESEAAGAAVAHIHVRDPGTGAPSMKVDHYREVLDRLKDAGSNVVINLTTGPGGRFVPTPGDPKTAAPDTTLLPPSERIRHIVELKPEMCTLDLNTMFSGSSVVMNTPDTVREMAAAMKEAGSLPELECFDTGDLHLANDLLAEGTLQAPPVFQLVMGVKYGFAPSPETVLYARSQLPENATWAAMGIGRMEFPIVAQSYLCGGHVRVGMEDNIFISRGKLTQGNGELVTQAKSIVESLGGSIASPDEARGILNLSRTASRTLQLENA